MENIKWVRTEVLETYSSDMKKSIKSQAVTDTCPSEKLFK